MSSAIFPERLDGALYVAGDAIVRAQRLVKAVILERLLVDGPEADLADEISGPAVLPWLLPQIGEELAEQIAPDLVTRQGGLVAQIEYLAVFGRRG